MALRLRLLFGGLGTFAVLFLMVGAPISAVFLRSADLTSWILFRGEVATASGVSTGCTATGARENERPVFANRFSFEEGGRQVVSSSYSTKACVRAGAPVSVEFPYGRPDLARIAGMRRAEFGPAVIFVAIFPLVGLSLLGVALWSARRTIHLLAHGRLALGTLVGTVKTNVTVNDRPVMKLRFAFTTAAGTRHEAELRTTDREALEDDPREALLYDPERPERAVGWDAIPGSPEVDFSGQLRATGSVSILVLLAPIVVVGLTAIVLLLD